MAATITPAELKLIVLKDYDCVNNPDLTPFIAAASGVLDSVLLCAAKKGIVIPTSTQISMLGFIAAHLYVQSDATYTQRQTLRASGSFNKQWDSYLKAAMLMDPSGCLDNAFKNNRVRAIWLGKRPSEQIPYDQRN